MNRRTTTFLIAACSTLGAHAAMFAVFPRYEVGGVVVHWPDGKVTGEMTIVFEPEPLPEPKPEVKALAEFEMGASDATGYASHDIPDKLEATAREADNDQASLSLDPTGAGESGTDAAVAEATGEGSTLGQPGGMPPSPPPAAVAEEITRREAESPPPFDLYPEPRRPAPVDQAPREPDAVTEIQTSKVPEEGEDETAARPVEASPAPEPASPPPVPQPLEVSEAEPAESRPESEAVPTPRDGGTRVGGSQNAAADPARMSDSESDPFSRLGTAVVRDGRLQIRFGRKVKTRRPKLLLAAQVDLMTLQRAQVVLKIDIDETGKVTSVKVAKSSGSDDIDQPTRVAVYDWWFEPKKDAAGRPIADQVQFTIEWR